jgi:hypothetical protein
MGTAMPQDQTFFSKIMHSNPIKDIKTWYFDRTLTHAQDAIKEAMITRLNDVISKTMDSTHGIQSGRSSTPDVDCVLLETAFKATAGRNLLPEGRPFATEMMQKNKTFFENLVAPTSLLLPQRAKLWPSRSINPCPQAPLPKRPFKQDKI